MPFSKKIYETLTMKKKILLFDDDFQSMEPFKNLLEAFDYAVELTASAGLLQRLKNEHFDLICVDFMIHLESPGENNEIVKNVHYDNIIWHNTGQEFLKRLRQGDYASENGSGTSQDVPTIVISATADPNEESPANYVFEKPFDPREVLEKIEHLLEKK